MTCKSIGPVPAPGKARVCKKGDRWYYNTKTRYGWRDTWQAAMKIIERYGP